MMTVAQFYEYIKATELYTLKVYTLTVHFLNLKKKTHLPPTPTPKSEMTSHKLGDTCYTHTWREASGNTKHKKMTE